MSVQANPPDAAHWYSIGLDFRGPAGCFSMLLDARRPLTQAEAAAWAAEVAKDHPGFTATLLSEATP